MAGDRPRGRAKNVTGAGKDVFRRGQGTGSGPVGSTGKRDSGASSGSDGKKGKKGLLGILAALLLLSGSALGLGDLLPAATAEDSADMTRDAYSDIFSMLGYSGYDSLYSNSSSSTGWDYEANTGKLNTKVSSTARKKFCKVSKADSVTVMVYMCGTDLESQGGMATADLQEMVNASMGENIDLIVYTGGCAKWKNSHISSSVNQIYKIESGGIRRLVSDAGNVSMTDPDTLASFISYCAKNFPADRNQLILWDHGGGAISGFGYDQKFGRSAMGLAGINEALRAGGVKFDFIGFDACLMATAENAIMLSNHADYLIASEETEPGTGWYYTNWLTELSEDPSVPTLELGRRIIDDYVDKCAQQTRGQSATLSLVDLAELSATVPEKLGGFASSTLELIEDDGYSRVSAARSSAREFSVSSKVDHVDLVHLSRKLGSDEGEALAKAVLGAVKYNRCSSNMPNSYGLSIYFPYRKASAVSQAVKAYEAIGMDEDYTRCIQAFAGYESAGQAMSGGSSALSPFTSLFDYYTAYSDYGYGDSSGSSTDYGYGDYYGYGDSSGYDSGYGYYGDYDYYGSYSYEDAYEMINDILGLMMGYGYSEGRSLDAEAVTAYVSENRFDPDALIWDEGGDGQYRISLSEEQWRLVHRLELNVFYDDGEGFIDLGLDNVYELDEAGNLLGSYDGTWLAIDSQPVAYYHISTVDDGENYSITGRVPVLINGVRADLILVFDNENPYGYVAGARYDYRDGETETVAKSLTGLSDGDVIDFLCDYYTYDGEYTDSYMLGEQYVVSGGMEISNVYLPDPAFASPCYLLTDMYHNRYWTPVLPG